MKRHWGKGRPPGELYGSTFILSEPITDLLLCSGPSFHSPLPTPCPFCSHYLERSHSPLCLFKSYLSFKAHIKSYFLHRIFSYSSPCTFLWPSLALYYGYFTPTIQYLILLGGLYRCMSCL